MAASDERVVHVRLRIELPEDEWIADVSREHPTAEFRLLAGYPTEDGAVHLGEIVAEDPNSAAEAIEDDPAVPTYQHLHADDNRALARYETRNTGFYDFIEAQSLAPEYPIVVRDGWFTVDFTATRSTFEAVESTLAASPLAYELLSVVESAETDDLLTDRQRAVIEVALQAGYFEVPRQCTLADVAADLGVDKSAASETIRRAEGRLVRWYLTAEPGR